MAGKADGEAEEEKEGYTVTIVQRTRDFAEVLRRKLAGDPELAATVEKAQKELLAEEAEYHAKERELYAVFDGLEQQFQEAAKRLGFVALIRMRIVGDLPDSQG